MPTCLEPRWRLQPVTGSVALLQQHYKNLYGENLTAASIKALIINSADEAGTNDGPDYSFGWGLMNTASAAEIVSSQQNFNYAIQEETLSTGEAFEFTIYTDGSSPLNVTTGLD